MKNINRSELVNDFVNSNNVFSYRVYEDIAKHYDKDNKMPNTSKIIKNLLEEQFSYLIDENIMDYEILEEWIGEIEKLDLYEITDNSIDYKDIDLMNSYKTFENWININEKNNLSIADIIKEGQFNAYLEMYNSIREDFTDYLNYELNELEPNY